MMTYTLTTRQAIEAIIRKYRNAGKREYAPRYFSWIAAGQQGDEPTSDLCFMARQAVRMDLMTVIRRDPFYKDPEYES